MMYEAGYNPIELAHFFQQLEAQGSRGGALSQFLSDHPNPGNRVAAVEDEIRQLPAKQFTTNTQQFDRIKDLVRHLPGPSELRSSYTDQHAAGPPRVRPSSRFRQYAANAFVIDYPENWEVFGDQNSPSATIAPRDAIFQKENGAAQIGYGVMISYYLQNTNQIDLQRDTNDLIQRLQQQNASMRAQGRQALRVDHQPAILTTITSQSPYQGETEIDRVVTIARPEGLFYIVFAAPSSESSTVQSVLEHMLQSLRFR